MTTITCPTDATYEPVPSRQEIVTCVVGTISPLLATWTAQEQKDGKRVWLKMPDKHDILDTDVVNEIANAVRKVGWGVSVCPAVDFDCGDDIYGYYLMVYPPEVFQQKQAEWKAEREAEAVQETRTKRRFWLWMAFLIAAALYAGLGLGSPIGCGVASALLVLSFMFRPVCVL